MPQPNDPFPSTQWSLVLRARDRPTPAADAALADLCRAYWYPLYVYLRRRVGSPERAEELTQELFARLLEKDFLAGVARDRGKFRAFLLACCNHLLANERDRERAQKRGGGRAVLSLDFPAAEARYRLEPADTFTPERLFQRRWALTLVENTLDEVQREFAAAGKGPLFEHLKGSLTGEAAAPSYAAVGAALGMTEAAVKKAAQRLRQRYRALLRGRIAATVDGPDAVAEEVRDLFAALAL